jgi:hypothetical protein
MIEVLIKILWLTFQAFGQGSKILICQMEDVIYRQHVNLQ